MHSIEDFNFQNIKAIKGELLLVEDTQGNSLSVTVRGVRKGSAHSGDYESFTTHLVDNEPQRIPQGSYNFSHSRIGQHFLFCTATSATDYEIVINRSNISQSPP